MKHLLEYLRIFYFPKMEPSKLNNYSAIDPTNLLFN
jgi:hypothetical protein